MSIYDGEFTTTYLYDAYDMLVDTFKGKGEGATCEQIRTQSVYDYRGRRIKREVSSIGLTGKTKTKEYSYSDGVSVLETSSSGTTLTYRGTYQGGGVGGVNYTEYANGNDLNYKIYNLRGDVIKTIGADKNTKSFSHYYAFGNHDDVYGSIPNDDFRANTKVEDESNLLNEGKRFRHLDLGIFLTPDPLEYVDGFNQYIYVNQNPWTKWDPTGLKWEVSAIGNTFSVNFFPTQSNNRSIDVSAWAKFAASSDYKLNSQKNYFVAIEINFVCKKGDNSIIEDSITLLRPARVDDNKVKNQEIKAFAQDSGNDVDVIKSEDKRVEVNVRIALYEGDISQQKAIQSDVKFADYIGSDGILALYNGGSKGQNENMWSAYAQSQISEIGSAYLTGNKTIEDFEKSTGLKSLDKSEKYKSGYNIEKKSNYSSSNLSKAVSKKDKDEEH